MISSYIPFCGVAPVPETLWRGWTFDPLLLAVLAAVGVLALRSEGGRWAAGAGWTLLAAGLVSPLCNLSVALFTAREAQHVVLLLLAAPLLALAWRGHGLADDTALPRRLVAGTVLFGAAFWFWHAPAAYDATLRGDPAWWAMHASMIASAILFWHALLAAFERQPHLAALAALATVIHMGVLGALLTLAQRPLYGTHLDTTLAWGLTPLEDQQLGGLVMWVPGGLILLGLSLAGMGRWLMRTDDGVAGWTPVMVEAERR